MPSSHDLVYIMIPIHRASAEMVAKDQLDGFTLRIVDQTPVSKAVYEDKDSFEVEDDVIVMEYRTAGSSSWINFDNLTSGPGTYDRAGAIERLDSCYFRGNHEVRITINGVPHDLGTPTNDEILNFLREEDDDELPF